jgi:hypothetical protein
MSRVSQLDELAISQSVSSFEATLMDSISLLMPQCDRLLVEEFRSGVRSNVIRHLLEAYKTIYQAVNRTENGYLNAATMFSYNPETIKTILHI